MTEHVARLQQRVARERKSAQRLAAAGEVILGDSLETAQIMPAENDGRVTNFPGDRQRAGLSAESLHARLVQCWHADLTAIALHPKNKENHDDNDRWRPSNRSER